MSHQMNVSNEPAPDISDVPALSSWTAGCTLPWTALAAATQQVLSAGIDAWRGLQQDIEIDIDEVRRANTLHEILERQTEFVMTEAVRSVRMVHRCWAGAFDIQSQWVRQAEIGTFDVLRSWVGRDVSSLAVPYPEPPDDSTPPGMLRWSQAVCMGLGSVWLGALKHDLENEPAPAMPSA